MVPQLSILKHVSLASFITSLIVCTCTFAASARDGHLTDEQYEKAANQGVNIAADLDDSLSHALKRFERAVACGQILVAEGDSWFSYPTKFDVVKALEEIKWAVFSVAHHGDMLESMLYDQNQLASLYGALVRTGRFEHWINRFWEMDEDKDEVVCKYDFANRDHYPKAILLSGGGNDLIGIGMPFILEHGKSSHDNALNKSIVDGLFHRMHRMLVEYIFAISHICKDVYKDPKGDKCATIPIILHGYDYVKASGKGYEWSLFGWSIMQLKGPWLEPTFKWKERLQESDEVIKDLIDRYNNLLCDVANRIELERKVNQSNHIPNPVIYVSFQSQVESEPNGYGESAGWEDELHPNREASLRLAKRIVEAITLFHGNGESPPVCIRAFSITTHCSRACWLGGEDARITVGRPLGESG